MLKEETFEEVRHGEQQFNYKCHCGIDVTADQLTDSGLQAYCQNCLLRQLAIQKQQVARLEERFIFYKEYESSISAGQLEMLKDSAVTARRQISVSSNQGNTYQGQQSLQKQEQGLLETLSQLKKKQVDNQRLLKQLKNQVLQQQREEAKYWDSINKFQRKLYKLEEKANAARWEIRHATEEYERLTSMNILAQVFKITSDSEVGYINGLAIGKRSKHKSEIDWEEVNAGLGQLFLLFCFLSIKYDYKCVRMMERICLGTCSTIKVSGGKILNLSYSKDSEKQFGQFMDEMLVELEHLRIHMDKVNQKQEKVEFAYRVVIPEYKIHGQPVNPTRIKTGKWDVWTLAMKYMLINFDYLATVYSLSDKSL